MNKQEQMDAVDRIEKLLLETDDVINVVVDAGVGEELAQQFGTYTCRQLALKAFKEKHGMAFAKWREQRTGKSNGEYIKNNRRLALEAGVERATRLLVNTRLRITEVCRMSGLSPQQLATRLPGLHRQTPTQYRKAHTNPTSIYQLQPATRKRHHFNGGLSISGLSRLDNRVFARQRMHDYISKDQAVLSLTITGLSFNVGELTEHIRLTVPGALLVKTAFLLPLKEGHCESDDIPVRLFDGSEMSVRLTYDVVARVVSLVFTGNRIPSHIEFTLMVTSTEL